MDVRRGHNVMAATKLLEIRPHRTIASMHEIVFAGGGQVPASLLGGYTHSHTAQSAIDLYLTSKKKVKE